METKDLYADLNSTHGNCCAANLYAHAITALNDHHKVLPLDNLDGLKIASVVIGDSIGNRFQTGLAALCAGQVVPLR